MGSAFMQHLITLTLTQRFMAKPFLMLAVNAPCEFGCIFYPEIVKFSRDRGVGPYGSTNQITNQILGLPIQDFSPRP